MFRAVLSHFEEFKEDQFDFHSYCLRKLTLRAYVDLLHMEDRLLSNPAFRDAATGAIRCYLRIHDRPRGAAQREAEERELAALPEAAQKKARDKKRREAEKKARLEAEQLERERAAHAAKKSPTKFDEVRPSTSRSTVTLAAAARSPCGSWCAGAAWSSPRTRFLEMG